MMLVLSRRLGEKIMIDGEIELEVLEVCGNRVRLGISAPQDYRVVRAERTFGGPAHSGNRAPTTLARAGN